MDSFSDFRSYAMQVSFVFLGILTLRDYLRYGGAVRRDIALMFASLAFTLGVGLISRLLVEPIPLLNLLSICSLVAQPYLLIRLVKYFRSLPPLISTGAVAGMVLSWLILLLQGTLVSQTWVLFAIVYFVFFNAYAMMAFVQSALQTSGVVQRRSQFAAAGSGLLALALLALGIGLLVQSIAAFAAALLQLSAIASAVAFYIGLAAPTWLRRAWQLVELREYLVMMTRDQPPASEAEVYDQLCWGAVKATGGNWGRVLLRQPDLDRWMPHEATDDSEAVSAETAADLERYLQKRVPAAAVARTLSAPLRRFLKIGETELLYIVPLVRSERMWGVILILREHGSLFIDDDLEIVSLFAEQSAVVLENLELIRHLRQYAESLEERSAHLAAVNHELEAFSYSVSHDLRAPLRAVDGFSQALLEDYNDSLDDMGRDFLNRIRTESQRMGQLIDDLIGLSRFTRTEMRLSTVSLSAIVREIAADLANKEPARTVQFCIQDEIAVCVDERLLRVVLQNLLDNAWKFTAKQPDARIEFGITSAAGVNEFYVRDNGAGFDMAYVNKLFGAFQRLHAMTEFTGTGIGLATVQRIIHRHGGTVRAEGAVNQGATFYFTLGAGNCA